MEGAAKSPRPIWRTRAAAAVRGTTTICPALTRGASAGSCDPILIRSGQHANRRAVTGASRSRLVRRDGRFAGWLRGVWLKVRAATLAACASLSGSPAVSSALSPSQP
jgi:hypothetical protein